MKKVFLIFFSILFAQTSVWAESVILMMGDGMGPNHLKCAALDKPLYLTTLPVQGKIHTFSASGKVTDSAASATAYACGKKTRNGYLGKLPDGTDCLTIAEEATQKGFPVGIYSTDYETGASPSAFYAHVYDRKDKENILKYKKTALEKMDVNVPVKKISLIVTPKLYDLLKQKRPFFAFLEGAKIDTFSHGNNLSKMKEELYDFDYSVMKAVNFVHAHPETTLIVLADHETGGLTEDCVYTTKGHTGQDINLYAYGKYASLFSGVQDNTEIHHKIKKILFQTENLK